MNETQRKSHQRRADQRRARAGRRRNHIAWHRAKYGPGWMAGLRDELRHLTPRQPLNTAHALHFWTQLWTDLCDTLRYGWIGR